VALQVNDTAWIRGKYGMEYQVRVKKILDNTYCMVEKLSFPHIRMKKRIEYLRTKEGEKHRLEREKSEREMAFSQLILENLKNGATQEDAYQQAYQLWRQIYGTEPPKV